MFLKKIKKNIRRSLASITIDQFFENDPNFRQNTKGPRKLHKMHPWQKGRKLENWYKMD